MKYLIAFIATFFSCTIYANAQGFKKTLNKDSLLQVILKDLPEDKKNELLKMYNETNDESKELFLMIFSMPRSSKKELISNIDSNFTNISLLKNSYIKLVPKDYTVSIEFNPADNILSTKESIDLKIERISNRQIVQEWNLEYNSAKLAQMLKPLNWTKETVMKIKKLLADANCVSIENGKITTIGFARSGMGKYYFKLFDNALTSEQIEKYNNGCSYIFYKKNIVLEYGGGAIGSQCFPDK